MDRPSECKWCRSGVRAKGRIIAFKCFTSVVDDCWSQSPECKLKGLEDRIQRAIDELKAAKRYRVSPGPRNTLDWDPDPDGYVTDSPAVDEALAILEGERDEDT